VVDVFMSLDDITEKLEQAKAEGKDPLEYLKELAKAEQEEKESLVRVQIMPGNAIAGYGRFPAIVDMPREKAEDLAKYGKVNILEDYSNVIQPTDTEKIQQHLEETVAIRKSIGSGRKEGVRESVLVNKKSSKKARAKKAEDEGGKVEDSSGSEEESKPKTFKKPLSRRTNI
jgi:hypothetical protein